MSLRGPALALLAAAGLLLAPRDLAAQDARVGLTVVAVQGRYDGPATTSFENRAGFGAGVFAEVATPLRPLHVRIEGRWLRRGSDEAGGGGAEMDLLSVPLALGLRFAAGPLAVLPSVGVEAAYPLAVRSSPDLEAGFGESARLDAAGFAGIEVQLDLGTSLRLGAEARRSRGFSATFEGPAGRLETRATEWIVRLSRPVR